LTSLGFASLRAPRPALAGEFALGSLEERSFIVGG
jgi:hypothetical protein